jgi:hypothetical protein
LPTERLLTLLEAHAIVLPVHFRLKCIVIFKKYKLKMKR